MLNYKADYFCQSLRYIALLEENISNDQNANRFLEHLKIV